MRSTTESESSVLRVPSSCGDQCTCLTVLRALHLRFMGEPRTAPNLFRNDSESGTGFLRLCAKPRVASCGKWRGACGVVQELPNARRTTREQAHARSSAIVPSTRFRVEARYARDTAGAAASMRLPFPPRRMFVPPVRVTSVAEVAYISVPKCS